MRTTHELKLWPEYFEQVRNGQMSFQLRRNDRDFKVGDHLLLKEWIPKDNPQPMRFARGYSGREVLVRVDYIIDDLYRFGLDPDYVIMSISHVNERRAPCLK